MTRGLLGEFLSPQTGIGERSPSPRERPTGERTAPWRYRRSAVQGRLAAPGLHDPRSGSGHRTPLQNDRRPAVDMAHRTAHLWPASDRRARRTRTPLSRTPEGNTILAAGGSRWLHQQATVRGAHLDARSRGQRLLRRGHVAGPGVSGRFRTVGTQRARLIATTSDVVS
jgi:hypothetical protein